MALAPLLVKDPGDTGTITIDRWGSVVPMVSAAAETRTLAAPNVAGLACLLVVDTYVGAITVTVTGGYDLAANTSLVFGAAGHWAKLVSVKVGTSYLWKILQWEGVTGPTKVTDFTKIQGITNGTAYANKAVVLGASKEIDDILITKLRIARTAVTAVGSVWSLATNSLAAGLNVVTGGGTNLGLCLPTPEVGMEVIVKNASASTVIVYGDKATTSAIIINALATTTGISVADTKITTFICDNTTRWWTLPLAIA